MKGNRAIQGVGWGKVYVFFFVLSCFDFFSPCFHLYRFKKLLIKNISLKKQTDVALAGNRTRASLAPARGPGIL